MWKCAKLLRAGFEHLHDANLFNVIPIMSNLFIVRISHRLLVILAG
jgi:hypothetical protein